DGVIVGSGVTSLERPDLAGPHGFRIELPSGIRAVDILRSNFRVIANENTPLPAYKTYMPSLMKSAKAETQFPSGITSPDKMFTVGSEGYFFVSGGHNKVAEQYSMSESVAKSYVEKWQDQIATRQA